MVVGKIKLVVKEHLLFNRINYQMLCTRCIEEFYLKEFCYIFILINILTYVEIQIVDHMTLNSLKKHKTSN